ncbi:MAG: hypothetical protein Q9M27_00845, partial [Mariprofundaceae bacterium]|nr:hypothetical protein [Mariprofundaceae bacterium]
MLKRNSPIGGDVEAVCSGTVPGHGMWFVLLEIEYLVNVFHIDEKRHDVGDLHHIVLLQAFGIVFFNKGSQTLMADILNLHSSIYNIVLRNAT